MYIDVYKKETSLKNSFVSGNNWLSKSDVCVCVCDSKRHLLHLAHEFKNGCSCKTLDMYHGGCFRMAALLVSPTPGFFMNCAVN